MRVALWVLVVAAGCGDGAGRKTGDCDGPCPGSKINHVVLVLQENHTFDNYFGRWCTAPAGSNPSCTAGKACCEAAPATEPMGHAPIVLDDTTNGAYDPNHTRDCELLEANGGAMDRYAAGSSCSDLRNVAYANGDEVAPYRALAEGGALADRYFQPLAGQSSANDMYFMRAQFVFNDNEFRPDAIGKECSTIPTAMTFTGPTIGSLLDDAGVSWSFYVEGYQATVDAVAATGLCAKAPPDCPFGLGIYPCVYEVGDNPIAYYAEFRDNPRVMRDFVKLKKDLDGADLPQVVFVRGVGYHSEHPGELTTISDGVKFVSSVVDLVNKSDYAGDTLVLVTWDEGGGYFDHIAPPGNGSDGQPYGTRVPLIASGPFARAGTVSHAQLEHSSVVKFLEWNWLGGQTGQLSGRDVTVRNLGSLLDPDAAGAAVPE